ncbi:methyltransferase domain-containing protein [Parashewanella curva]|uniref:Ribosomal RNA small subunit methyltransferase C n=1 Tax=Parashewanella curva TaxID=2338552 RepID=A0A3L8PWC1_9GAMM|nr:methyltransferase [Parashewanella curva]RLV59747.1 methyltransferase domain-containing protein [Parashewanella curva]
MLTNSSQLLLRNTSLFAQQSVLVINIEADHLAQELLSTTQSVTALALDYNHYQQLKPLENNQLSVHFGHQLPELNTFDNVIIYFPKAKPLAGYLYQLAAQYLDVGGSVFLVGENKGGIKSAPKTLPDYFSKATKLDNARHCLLYVSELMESAPELSTKDWCSQYLLPTPQGELTICNMVGVFSQKQLDAGTALLLENITEFQGRVLDFGCGAGVITAALLKAQPELKLECVDINAMALLSCELTLKANNFRAKVYPSDGLAQVEGELDGIVSNPPFHDGLMATTDIAERFVKDSANALTDKGVFQIVANRHLPYSDALQQHFGKVNTTAENNKYKVYQN